MKKLILVLVLCSILFSCSCSSFLQFDELHSDSQSEAKECLTELVDSILSKDKDAIYDMFSKNAQSEISTLSEDIDGLLNYCQGDLISFHGDLWSTSSGDEMIDGYTIEYIFGAIDFETTTGYYRLATVFYPVYESDPDNEGIWSLSITKTDITSNKWAYPHKLTESSLGIYYYENYLPDSEPEEIYYDEDYVSDSETEEIVEFES